MITTLDPIQVTEKIDLLKTKREELIKAHKKEITKIDFELTELNRLDKMFVDDVANTHYVQIAERIIEVEGNISGTCQGESIAELAAIDFAKGLPHLKSEFFGNKRYEGFYQRNDCQYGYGPRHGYIVDRVGLKQSARERDLTEEEKVACIYYLKNYSKIKSLTLA